MYGCPHGGANILLISRSGSKQEQPRTIHGTKKQTNKCKYNRKPSYIWNVIIYICLRLECIKQIAQLLLLSSKSIFLE